MWAVAQVGVAKLYIRLSVPTTIGRLQPSKDGEQVILSPKPVPSTVTGGAQGQSTGGNDSKPQVPAATSGKDGVSYFVLTVEPFEKGEELQSQLILLIEEARKVQIVHWE